jgi:hypothetical protein
MRFRTVAGDNFLLLKYAFTVQEPAPPTFLKATSTLFLASDKPISKSVCVMVFCHWVHMTIGRALP